jgi:uncharacterized secreted protein with C-terminal beta-propeller domain
MKKIIFSGAFLLTLSAVFIFGIHSGSDAPSQATTLTIDQKACITDSQANAEDGVPVIESERAFVAGQNSASPLEIQEAKITQNLSSGVVPARADATLASGGASVAAGNQTNATSVAPVRRGGLAALTSGTSGTSVVEPGAAKAALPVSKAQPANLPVLPKQTPSQGELPVVGSYENLKKLLEKVSPSGFHTGWVGGEPFIALPMVMPAMMRDSTLGNMALASAQNAGTAVADTPDYSTTNLQVEGVDEADIVKTDGTYIYQVNRQRIVIAKAFPPENMEIAGALSYTDNGFTPQEMYVDENHLVVIGSSSTYFNFNYPQKQIGVRMMMMPFYYCPREMTKALIYDITDKSDIKKIRELELNGAYVSSRKVGQSLYLVANKNLYFYSGMEMEEPKPSYRDSAIGDAFTEIDYPDIKYFPDFVESSYLILAGLNLDRPREAASVSGYLGSGQNIYASMQNLYAVVTGYCQNSISPVFTGKFMPQSNVGNTKIYKFAMNAGRLTFAAGGKVPGTVLNQFSMDEYGEYFRIATMKGEIWGIGENTSKNNVYVLDGALNVVGKVEGIAPGEKIYSVRFMGERGYMVTYRTVDPFFVLDLKDPCNPAILGELKIPGYSDYLHPYDENHVIGFGKDSVEIWGTAYYLGMKMAIFDVSDVSNPLQMFSEKIGDRGTDSELLRNHKALLFSKDRNLLAFPVRIMEVNENAGNPDTNVLQYGSFSFQGAYVYNIDLVNGFVPKGKISHLSEEDYTSAGSCWWNDEKYIERIIYIDDTLYTLSKGMIKANAIADLEEINSLDIE